MTNVEEQIMALFPTEQGIYTLEQLQVIRMHVMDLLKEWVAAKVEVVRYDEPHLIYKGQKIEVTSEGLARNTKIKVDGQFMHFVRDIRIEAGVEGGVHVTVAFIDIDGVHGTVTVIDSPSPTSGEAAKSEVEAQ